MMKLNFGKFWSKEYTETILPPVHYVKRSTLLSNGKKRIWNITETIIRRIKKSQLICLLRLVGFSLQRIQTTYHFLWRTEASQLSLGGPKDPQFIREYDKGSPMVKAWCAPKYRTVRDLYFFGETTVNDDGYLRMLRDNTLDEPSRNT